MDELSLPELHNIARSLDITYIKRYRKADLIKEIARVYNIKKKLEKNKKFTEIFPFDDEIFIKQKKKRKKEKYEICEKYISKTRMNLHKARHNPEPDFILIEVVYKGRLLTYQHNNQEENLDIEGYMNEIKKKQLILLKML